MKKYRLIIFDWDGTVFNSLPRILACYRKTFELFQLPAPDEDLLRRVGGKDWDDAIVALLPDEEPSYRKDLQVIYHHVWREGGLETPDLLPGAADLMGELREKGYLLAVGTSRWRKSILHDMEHFGMSSFFHTVRGADETARKPDPAMIHSILEELDVPPEAAVMIGDSDNDMRMAVNAGVDGIAVRSGGLEAEDFAEHKPVTVLDSILGLRTVLA